MRRSLVGPSLQIARLDSGDIDGLASLYRQLVDHEPDLSTMRAAFRDASDNKNHLVVGAKDSAGQLIGSGVGIICETLVGKCKPFMVIEDVVVDRAARRAGVGRALMSVLERAASERGCSYILLMTDADRPEAQSFYSSLGYSNQEYVGSKKTLASNT